MEKQIYNSCHSQGWFQSVALKYLPPFPTVCRSWNFPFYFQTTPTPEKPPLLLGISGLQLKGPLVSGGRWGSGGGSSEEVNSPRGYRPMSCFICKAQCWLSLLTASHVHEVDRTTAGSCAFQWLLREYFHSLFMGVRQDVTICKSLLQSLILSCSVVPFLVCQMLEFRFCPLRFEKEEATNSIRAD